MDNVKTIIEFTEIPSDKRKKITGKREHIE